MAAALGFQALLPPDCVRPCPSLACPSEGFMFSVSHFCCGFFPVGCSLILWDFVSHADTFSVRSRTFSLVMFPWEALLHSQMNIHQVLWFCFVLSCGQIYGKPHRPKYSRQEVPWG